MVKPVASKPSAMSLEEEKRDFYAALGEALTEWASVENMLYLIFLGCISPAGHQTAAAAYYAVDNFRAKLRMVDSVVRLLFLRHPAIDEWKELKTDAEAKSRKRNELAQHEVLLDPAKKPGRRYILRPALLNPLNPNVFDKNQGLHLNELRERIKVFQELVIRIRTLHVRLGEGNVYYVSRKGYISTKGEVPPKPNP